MHSRKNTVCGILFFFLFALGGTSFISFLVLDTMFGNHGETVSSASARVFVGSPGVYGVFWDGPATGGEEALTRVTITVNGVERIAQRANVPDAFQRNLSDNFSLIGKFTIVGSPKITASSDNGQYIVVVRHDKIPHFGYLFALAAISLLGSFAALIGAKTVRTSTLENPRYTSTSTLFRRRRESEK